MEMGNNHTITFWGIHMTSTSFSTAMPVLGETDRSPALSLHQQLEAPPGGSRPEVMQLMVKGKAADWWHSIDFDGHLVVFLDPFVTDLNSEWLPQIKKKPGVCCSFHAETYPWHPHIWRLVWGVPKTTLKKHFSDLKNRERSALISTLRFPPHIFSPGGLRNTLAHMVVRCLVVEVESDEVKNMQHENTTTYNKPKPSSLSRR